MRGTLDLPGDKSLSHRVAMLAALATGTCSIQNYNTGADCASTLRCLEQLGVRFEGTVRIHPPPALNTPEKILDCGNSGSTIRFFQGLLAGKNIPATLTGDESLNRRPMKRVADPLRKMGAIIHLTRDDFPPVRIEEGVKHPIEYRMPISSAQVKTAVLLAGLNLPGTRVIEPVPSRDHTERLLQFLKPDQGKFPAFHYDVPGDPSAAAFFVVAALFRNNSDLLIRNLLVNPHRIAYVRILQRSGAPIQIENERIVQNEPVADLRVEGSTTRLLPIRITAEEVPSVIDEIPALSMLGTRCGFEVAGAEDLRNKESDRIHAMVSNFEAMGIHAREERDGYHLTPGSFQRGVAKTFGDHRIAMAFASAGIEIDDSDCVKISLPEFFPLLEKLNA
jgi:3-phosphoshikimate 1-carboxyvinyltransferase